MEDIIGIEIEESSTLSVTIDETSFTYTSYIVLIIIHIEPMGIALIRINGIEYSVVVGVNFNENNMQIGKAKFFKSTKKQFYYLS
jgi:hypothetical protein